MPNPNYDQKAQAEDQRILKSLLENTDLVVFKLTTTDTLRRLAVYTDAEKQSLRQRILAAETADALRSIVNEIKGQVNNPLKSPGVSASVRIPPPPKPINLTPKSERVGKLISDEDQIKMNLPPKVAQTVAPAETKPQKPPKAPKTAQPTVTTEIKPELEVKPPKKPLRAHEVMLKKQKDSVITLSSDIKKLGFVASCSTIEPGADFKYEINIEIKKGKGNSNDTQDLLNRLKKMGVQVKFDPKKDLLISAKLSLDQMLMLKAEVNDMKRTQDLRPVAPPKPPKPEKTETHGKMKVSYYELLKGQASEKMKLAKDALSERTQNIKDNISSIKRKK